MVWRLPHEMWANENVVYMCYVKYRNHVAMRWFCAKYSTRICDQTLIAPFNQTPSDNICRIHTTLQPFRTMPMNPERADPFLQMCGHTDEDIYIHILRHICCTLQWSSPICQRSPMNGASSACAKILYFNKVRQQPSAQHRSTALDRCTMLIGGQHRQRSTHKRMDTNRSLTNWSTASNWSISARNNNGHQLPKKRMLAVRDVNRTLMCTHL